MKTLRSAILVSLSVGLLSVAVAEPFNDRGADWVKTLTPGKQAIAHSESYPITGEQGFNGRGEDWVAKLTPSATRQSPDQCPVNDLLATQRDGFNKKYNFQC